MTHHQLQCPHCKRSLTAGEVIERWCVTCEKATDQQKRAAA